jgi:hypothetical protein
MEGILRLQSSRVSVYVVGANAAPHGSREARATYPHLPERQVELATVYATAHPRKGRLKSIAFSTKGKVVAP